MRLYDFNYFCKNAPSKIFVCVLNTDVVYHKTIHFSGIHLFWIIATLDKNWRWVILPSFIYVIYPKRLFACSKYETCSRLTIKTPERDHCHWMRCHYWWIWTDLMRCFGVFIIGFNNVKSNSSCLTTTSKAYGLYSLVLNKQCNPIKRGVWKI